MSSANILLRGQSNADLLGSEDLGAGYVPGNSDATGLEYVQYVVYQLTGLNTNRIYESDEGGIGSGNQTAYCGGGTIYADTVQNFHTGDQLFITIFHSPGTAGQSRLGRISRTAPAGPKPC